MQEIVKEQPAHNEVSYQVHFRDWITGSILLNPMRV